MRKLTEKQTKALAAAKKYQLEGCKTKREQKQFIADYQAGKAWFEGGLYQYLEQINVYWYTEKQQFVKEHKDTGKPLSPQDLDNLDWMASADTSTRSRVHVSSRRAGQWKKLDNLELVDYGWNAYVSMTKTGWVIWKTLEEQRRRLNKIHQEGKFRLLADALMNMKYDDLYFKHLISDERREFIDFLTGKEEYSRIKDRLEGLNDDVPF